MQAFISRAQTSESEFTRLLQARGWQVQGQSLLRFEALPFEAVPACDWVFFASKNAVRFFFEELRRKKQALPAAKWAALGAATADVLAGYVEKIDFTGNGEPEATARDFQALFFPETKIRLLLPAARHSMQSIAAHLDDRFEITYLEVYDNQPIVPVFSRKETVLVFTSPMNARAYFSNHALLAYQKVVAIGASTAAALRRLGIAEVAIAAEPSEESLAETVLRLA